MPRFNYRHHLIGFSLAVAYLLLLVLTSPDLALSRDESFYVDASKAYAEWIQLLWNDPGQAIESETVDRYWHQNHEHPSLMKTLAGVAWLLQQKYQFAPSHTLVFRLPAMLLASFLIWLCFVFAARLYGSQAGILAAVGLGLIPRFFYHAHLHGFDVPIGFFTTLVFYCYWRSLYSKRWAVAAGFAFGLALATKHNSWLLPAVILIHWSWVNLRPLSGHEAKSYRIPWSLISMSTLSPLLFYALWPWLWHEPLARFAGYVNFHTHHAQHHGVVNVEYFGENLFAPPFPIELPFVLTALTLPLTFLLLAALGIIKRIRCLVPQVLLRPLAPRVAPCPDARSSDVLIFGAFLSPLVLIALPQTPVFGGTKHWLTAYPFMAMFFGVGASFVISRACHLWDQRAQRPRVSQICAPLLTGLLLTPSAVETVHSHPYALTHYNVLAGGVPGAATMGMNRQFWGFTTTGVLDFLRQRMPEGGTLWLCDMTYGAWQMLQEDGLAPRNIRATHHMALADFVLVHHELHFAEVDFQAWMATQSTRPVYVLLYDGVPVISVYENMRR